MASWWKLIVANTGAASSSGGAYAKRVANKFGSQNQAGDSWEQKIGRHQHYGTTGSFGRRLVNFSGTISQTAYGTAGSYGRQIKNQNLLS